MLWNFSYLRLLTSVWCAIVIFSTIPIGGHYVVDLIAGGLVFMIWSGLAKAIASIRRQPSLDDATELLGALAGKTSSPEASLAL